MGSICSCVQQQRDSIQRQLLVTLGSLAEKALNQTPESFEQLLRSSITDDAPLDFCNELYLLDPECTQITPTFTPNGAISIRPGKRLSLNNYARRLRLSGERMLLSDVFLDYTNQTSQILALHSVCDSMEISGYLVAQFELRCLPQTAEPPENSRQWVQVKGDPAIRGQLFDQRFTQRAIDEYIDDVISIITELITERGVFLCKLRFSSSMAMIHLYDAPYEPYTLILTELINPELCLAYPLRDYPEQAHIPATLIRQILEKIKKLRYADENIYLRSAALNIISGMVELIFSCDGTYQMPYEEFLEKGDAFWFGLG